MLLYLPAYFFERKRAADKREQKGGREEWRKAERKRLKLEQLDKALCV